METTHMQEIKVSAGKKHLLSQLYIQHSHHTLARCNYIVTNTIQRNRYKYILLYSIFQSIAYYYTTQVDHF